MTRVGQPRTIDWEMATSLAPDAKHGDWAEPLATPLVNASPAGGEWLWTIAGLALLVAFLLFVVDDYPLRALISAR